MPVRRKGRQTLLFVAVAAVAALTATDLRGASVVGSKHDLSSPGMGYSDQVCAFCHTPHSSNRLLDAPLWNRFVDRTKVYTLYQSATLDTVPGNPNDSLQSVLCLGCHDGTLGTAVVAGIVGSDKHDLVNAPGPGGIPDTSSWPNCQRCHPDIYGDPPVQWTGLNLSNDHPIAMTYPTSAQDPFFQVPPSVANGWPDVPLYGGKVECATCHDVHDPGIVPYLRLSNVGSQLCLTCHLK